MKTKILFSIFFAAVMIGACKKETIQPGNGNNSTPTPNTGTLYFKNTQIDPYTIYLDGNNIGVLAVGATSSSYTVTSGISHACKASQASGYVLYPTIYNGTATLNPGGTVTWTF